MEVKVLESGVMEKMSWEERDSEAVLRAWRRDERGWELQGVSEIFLLESVRRVVTSGM